MDALGRRGIRPVFILDYGNPLYDNGLAPQTDEARQAFARFAAAGAARFKGRGVVWVLSRPDLAERFNVVLVMEKGKLAEQGAFAELKSNGGPLHKLLVAA